MLRLQQVPLLASPFLRSPVSTPHQLCCFYSTTKTSQISNKRTVQFDILEDPSKKKKKNGYKPRKKIFKYFMIHKPFNVLSQFSPQKPILNKTPKSTPKTEKDDESTTPKKTLQHYFSLKNIYPVGRLDTDSEGLLLLTDNVKGITQRLLHPNQRHERTYLAQVEGIPTPEALQKLQEGVKLREFTTLPAKAEVLKEDPGFPERNPPIRQRKNSPTSWIKLTLTEGKNRQVRRMTAAVGFPTLRLIRTNIAGLEIGDLKAGKFRELTREEMTELENRCNLKKDQRNTKRERINTQEQTASLEKQRIRTREANEERKKKANWWVDLQKHYMTAKDYQDEMFDKARQSEELEEMEKVKEIEDKIAGRAKKNRFDDEDEYDEDEEGEEEIDLSVEPKNPKKESKVPKSKESKSSAKVPKSKETKKKR